MKRLRIFDTEEQYNSIESQLTYPTVSAIKQGTLLKILSNIPQEPSYDPELFNGYDYIDLGLPSGTLWATTNVGASEPTEYGMTFSWADSTGYYEEDNHNFTITKYKYKASSKPYYPFTKYNQNDNKTIIDLSDDGARENMGGSWRIPSIAQAKELINPTYTTITTEEYYPDPNNLEYCEYFIKITSKTNNNFIHFPILYSDDFGTVSDNYTEYIYWTNECAGGTDPNGYFFTIFDVDSAVYDIGGTSRAHGGFLRAVIIPT